jgi:solute:Na+ symporter, SSS family
MISRTKQSPRKPVIQRQPPSNLAAVRSAAAFIVAFSVFLTTSVRVLAADEPSAATGDVACSDLSLPQPPQTRAGSFAGVSGNALIIAGGASVGGGQTDEVYVLPANRPGETPIWRPALLHEKLAWGASVTINDSLLCIGGIGSNGCQTTVIRLKWRDGKLSEQNLPELPVPRAWAGAAALGNVLFVIGGSANPDGSAPSNDLYSLDLSDPHARWQTKPSLPGRGVIQPAVIGQYYGLEVLGGRALRVGGDAGRGFESISDCWVFRPKPLDFTQKEGWIRLADLPLPLAQGATIASGQAHTILVGADMQSRVLDLKNAWTTAKPYLPILAYHAVTDTWSVKGNQTGGAAGQIAVLWDNRNVLVGGADSGGLANSFQELVIHPLIRGLHVLDYIVIVGYILLITAIGLTFSRKQKSTVEFSLGGREAPWWVAALSLYATATSSISLMAVPALTYATNLVWLFQPIISIFVLVPQAFLVIPLIRRLNLTSTYEYLEQRFNPALRLLASFQCIVFYTIGRASVVILIPSIAISAVTGMNVFVAIIGVGLLTTFYTSLGGIDAVMWTDVLQAGVMLLGPLITIGVVLFSFKGNFAAVADIGSHYGKFDLTIWSWTATQPAAWIMILTVALTVTGFAGDQAMVQRVLSTPDDKAARKATLGNWVVCTVGAVIVQVMGILLFVYFHAHPAKLDPTMQNDRIVPLFAVQVLPVGVAGMILAGIFAASMSCLSGTINSAATLIVQDFYLRWRPLSSDRVRLRLMKILSYVVGTIATVVAAWLAKMPMRSLMETWTTIFSLCGAGFVGVYTLGMFTKRANGIGAMIGAIASVVVTFFIAGYTPLHWTLYTPLAIVTCMVVGYAASLLSPAPRRNLSGLTAFTLGTPAIGLKAQNAGLASVA